jgi:hypothetical protein
MISTKISPKIRYRKTKSGEWVVYGPASAVQAGRSVTVTKSDGSTKTEHIDRVGRPFGVDGVSMVYGYLGAREPETRATYRRAHRDDSRGRGGYRGNGCWSCTPTRMCWQCAFDEE